MMGTCLVEFFQKTYLGTMKNLLLKTLHARIVKKHSTWRAATGNVDKETIEQRRRVCQVMIKIQDAANKSSSQECKRWTHEFLKAAKAKIEELDG